MDLGLLPIDLQIAGRLIAGSITYPSGQLGDDAVQAAAGLSASKLQHQHQPCAVLCDHATAAAAKRVQLHRVKGATATVVSFHAVCSVAPSGGDSVTLTLKKNGSTILSASVTLNNTTVAFTAVAGTVSTPDLVAGDVLEAEISAVSGTSCKGVSCHAVIREAAQ